MVAAGDRHAASSSEKQDHTTQGKIFIPQHDEDLSYFQGGGSDSTEKRFGYFPNDRPLVPGGSFMGGPASNVHLHPAADQHLGGGPSGGIAPPADNGAAEQNMNEDNALQDEEDTGGDGGERKKARRGRKKRGRGARGLDGTEDHGAVGGAVGPSVGSSVGPGLGVAGGR